MDSCTRRRDVSVICRFRRAGSAPPRGPSQCGRERSQERPSDAGETRVSAPRRTCGAVWIVVRVSQHHRTLGMKARLAATDMRGGRTSGPDHAAESGRARHEQAGQLIARPVKRLCRTGSTSRRRNSPSMRSRPRTIGRAAAGRRPRRWRRAVQGNARRSPAAGDAGRRRWLRGERWVGRSAGNAVRREGSMRGMGSCATTLGKGASAAP